ARLVLDAPGAMDRLTHDEPVRENSQSERSATPETGASDIPRQRFDGEDSPEVRPFECLPELPGDLIEAFEALKLVILRHKLQGWRETTSREILAYLDAYKALVTAP
ncbi:MAG TPA: hypothetical protein VIY86_06720, partial [Pirellulaceae bacterium]